MVDLRKSEERGAWFRFGEGQGKPLSAMAMRGLRNRNQTSVIFLVMRLCQELYALEDKPPVTLVLLFGQIALHILMVPGKDYTYRDVCNWPAKILYDPNLYDWGKRVLLSSFIHADDYHLTSNMIAFLHKGEMTLGSLTEMFIKC